MFKILKFDIDRANISWLRLFIGILIFDKYGALFYLRFYQFLEQSRLPTFLSYRILLHIYGLEMARGCKIGPGLYLPHPKGILFAEGTVVGKCVSIYGMVRFLGVYRASPTIGDDVFIGDGARFIGGITIDNHCIIGAGAIVTKSFPDGTIIAGNPARVIRDQTSSRVERETYRVPLNYLPNLTGELNRG